MFISVCLFKCFCKYSDVSTVSNLTIVNKQFFFDNLKISKMDFNLYQYEEHDPLFKGKLIYKNYFHKECSYIFFRVDQPKEVVPKCELILGNLKNTSGAVTGETRGGRLNLGPFLQGNR